MRFTLFMLTSSFLALSGCISETTSVAIADEIAGASLSFYIPSPTKSADDPWGTISSNFLMESSNHKSSENDPWETINSLFLAELADHKSGGNDPWETIRSLATWQDYARSSVVFVSFKNKVTLNGVGEVVEVRGRVAKITFSVGDELFMVDIPAIWEVGTLVECTFYAAAIKDDCSFTGVRTWRVF
jgi:hypothetical protein